MLDLLTVLPGISLELLVYYIQVAEIYYLADKRVVLGQFPNLYGKPQFFAKQIQTE